MTALVLVSACACNSAYSTDPGQSADDAGVVDDATADSATSQAGDGGGADGGLDGDSTMNDGGYDANHLPGVCGADCHVMFATSGSFLASLGGVAGADTMCRNAAAASMSAAIAARASRFIAWISVGNAGDPGMTTRLPTTGTFARPDGTVIAASPAALLSGSLINAVLEDENGVGIVNNNQAWTATGADGKTTSGTCVDWSTTMGSGAVGKTNDNGSGWTANGTAPCGTARRLYCMDAF